MSVNLMTELSLSGKKVLIREDLNVPLQEGVITSSQRIDAALPGIRLAMEQGAAVILMSHLGRPVEGEYDAQYSLQPVADYLSEQLGRPVPLLKEWLNGVDVAPGELVLCENVRFNKGEKKNDEALSRQMAALCDIFVMDAFGTSHRAQASTHGVARYATVACAGPLLAAELEALSSALDSPKKPLVAIVAGSKVSTKLTILENLCEHVDQLIVGGGIANTFLAAKGFPVGKSLYEPGLIDDALRIMKIASDKGVEIPLPTDVVCGPSFGSDEATLKSVNDVTEADMIFDVGPESAAQLAELLKTAATIVWNGPIGVFEFDQYGKGTHAMALAIAASPAFSIAGGGDTVAAIDKYGIADQVGYISTGGGAFLEFLEGKKLPAVAILEERFSG